MPRPLNVTKHASRLEIDFLIAHGVQLTEIAGHFDMPASNLRRYERSMVAADPRYFKRLARENLTIFQIAKAFADSYRRSLAEAAEAQFATICN